MPAEKILVVDDERLVRWSLRQKCEEWGYQVLEEEGTNRLHVLHLALPPPDSRDLADAREP